MDVDSENPYEAPQEPIAPTETPTSKTQPLWVELIRLGIVVVLGFILGIYLLLLWSASPWYDGN